ncbi:MAG TPA: type VI secretion system protein TssA [Caulobacteraceae bacterium]|nr:type VI secretion system protein TssA [Caulobacteraceae bacterium]
MAVDVESLLVPISEEAPAGEDLSYDPERVEIEQVFERSVSMDITGEAEAAEDVDWRRVVSLIQAQSARTKDLWLAVYLCRAGARAGDLDQVAAGAAFLEGLCERFWDTMHPALDEYGFQGRKGPCESLSRVGEFLGPLKRTILLAHPRLGRFTGADFERFRAGGDGEEGYGQFRAALNETPDETLVEAAARLDAIAASIRAADAILTAKAEGDTGPNFQPTYAVLAELRKAVLSFSAAPPAEEEEASPAAGGYEAAAAGSGPSLSGSVNSREDVLRALDAIGDYYRRKEPSSPVPVVLQRARDWVNLDFLGVLEDIAPGSMEEARKVLTSQRGG